VNFTISKEAPKEKKENAPIKPPTTKQPEKAPPKKAAKKQAKKGK
jgi:hypothetical protein